MTNDQLPKVKLIIEDDDVILEAQQQQHQQKLQQRQQKQDGDYIFDWKEEVKVTFKVEETPPVSLCLLLAFQHYMTMCVANLTVPILLAPSICMFDDNVGKSEITGTLFVASGIITLVQSFFGVRLVILMFFGVRLPIVQAGTFALLVPTLSYLSLPQWKCPDNIVDALNNDSTTTAAASTPYNNNNITSGYIISGSEEHRQIWMTRLREIQGCIMLAAIFEVLVGGSGLVGCMMKFIGPLTICPTVTLLGLSLFKSAPQMASKHWGIAILTISLVIIFSQYLGRIRLPCFVYGKQQGCIKHRFPLFKMFPIVLSILVSSLLCYILTATNSLPSNPGEAGYHARTDLRLPSIHAAPWFRIPYPGQWGIPTFSLSGVFAILSGVLATTIESVGDYYSCAKLAGAPPPPVHAINRGILVEGLGSMLDGLFGTGNGTTSTSVNVGVVGITKVGSRVVIQVSALIMIVFGLFVKVGAIFLAIPDPVIGGTFFTLFGMITAVGLSNLQHVNLNSSRNLFIIGFSILTGLAIPEWINSNINIIDTGNKGLDNVVVVLLKTNMFVGGVLGFILDNTIPGSRKTRGMFYWDILREMSQQQHHQHQHLPATTVSSSSSPLQLQQHHHQNSSTTTASQQTATTQKKSYLMTQLASTYDLPLSKYWLHKFKIFRQIPLCPNYQGTTSLPCLRFICPLTSSQGTPSPCCCKNNNSNRFIKCLCRSIEICCRRCNEDDEDDRDDDDDDGYNGGGVGSSNAKLNGFKMSEYSATERLGQEEKLISSSAAAPSLSAPPSSLSAAPSLSAPSSSAASAAIRVNCSGSTLVSQLDDDDDATKF
ncbi:hypothetical protein HELRODRAFT_195039 [Helobdella robusta]|uniref:Uncharacterized protein n=1 Tax=Helobdella robusta TaxID=6412 RepID=T1FWP2_HELRO|nr:hypothetical protein HELRODRAFT_195039 [Helobdella robusta]ESO09709.1 hypothetical protein HELRODRAFT_195039 [Helobdella robusta]